MRARVARRGAEQDIHKRANGCTQVVHRVVRNVTGGQAQPAVLDNAWICAMALKTDLAAKPTGPRFYGRGLGTEAARRALGHAFGVDCHVMGMLAAGWAARGA